MKVKYLLLITACAGLYPIFSSAQSLTEITGKRFYEHHSSSMNNGSDFGAAANGTQAGYDFVNNTYFSSFDAVTWAPYDGEETNIDMVEHNGPFGNGGNFGFTSGISSIWNPDIYGNNSTRWMLAPGSFNYAAADDVSDISAAFNTSTASNAVEAVGNNAVYLAKIRGTNRYVAMRCYNVHNLTGQPTGPADVYFDFDYKYGTLSALGTDELSESPMKIYPNLVTSGFVTIEIPLENKAVKGEFYTAAGQLVKTISLQQQQEKVAVTDLPSGIYFLHLQPQQGAPVVTKLTISH